MFETIECYECEKILGYIHMVESDKLKEITPICKECVLKALKEQTELITTDE